MRRDGYRSIGIFNRVYLAHRLAFLYMIGEFPRFQTDHINGIRNDNRWNNLRQVTNQENGKNQKTRDGSVSGKPGVNWFDRDRKWRARIQAGEKEVHLGYFDDIDAAIIARGKAEIKYGYHKNHGRLA